MIDIFLQKDASALLKNKHIVFMGDSNTRALYKDILCLINQTKFIPANMLKSKMEASILGDQLVYHGAKSNGRDYREEREFSHNRTKIAFYFITCVYNDYVESCLKNIASRGKPDVIVVNSCLWDVTRWGHSGVDKYKVNLPILMKRYKKLFPNCLVIWTTAPPISCEMRGGFLVSELQFLRYSIRFHVMEANHYASKVVVQNGFDVLDFHYHLKMQIHRRAKDGIHWLPPAVRYLTNLLLTHISLAWGVALPHRYKPSEEVNCSSIEDRCSSKCIQKEKMKSEKPSAKDKKEPLLGNSTDLNEGEKNNKTSSEKKAKRPTLMPYKVQQHPKVSESHHDYLNRVQKKKRKRRVRNWQKEASANNPHSFVPNSQFVIFNDHQKMNHPSHPMNTNVTQCPSIKRIPLLSQPYPSSQMTNSRNFPLPPHSPFPDQTNQWQVQSSHLIYPSEAPMRRGLQWRQPYVFPTVAPGQILRPVIDFTSDECFF